MHCPSRTRQVALLLAVLWSATVIPSEFRNDSGDKNWSDFDSKLHAAGTPPLMLAAVASPSPVASREAVPGPVSKYGLEFGSPHTVEATLRFDIHAPRMKAEEWIVFAAEPPRLAHQTAVSFRVVPDGLPYQDLEEPHRALMRSRTKARDDQRSAFSGRLEYRASLASRRLVEREPGKNYPSPEPLAGAARARWLASGGLFDFTSSDFRRWQRDTGLGRASSESDVDFARRVFLTLRRRLRYEYHDDMDRHASHIAQNAAGDCGGMSVLFASVMRSSGVPARVLAGRWAKSSKPGETVGDVRYFQQHVKAEFYAAGVGWVPVDLSSAVEHDHTAEGLQYFGVDRGNFLAVHIDPTISVDTIHFGRQTFAWLQGVKYYVSGQGTVQGSTFDETWTVTQK